MNKTISCLLLACCVVFSPIYGDQPLLNKATFTPAQKSQNPEESFMFEGKVSYFMPSSSQVSNIYHNGWLNYQVSATYLFPIGLGKEHKIGVFSSLNYLHSRGESLGGDYSTRIRILPLTLGLRYLYAFYFDDIELDVYGNLGARYNWINIRNHCPYVETSVNPNCFGGVAELGAIAAFAKYFLINVFMDYSVANTSSSVSKPFVYKQTLSISGFSIGGGLGVRF
ncbi:hypothetical protein COB21_01575 [Candidatus Aerophobetes bacterium]|uniref:Outer membrane protein beta-barrel domain-containing protein n=1 Tax=Aerophobetes bacterium TaxID=2030807 RepID=A0A2A4X6Q6_UNCAE|nr:MAG: hypothetical protein COB21_01575 [Candidatus Aerophobetes bacterium]